jgi:hypothetical protein
MLGYVLERIELPKTDEFGRPVVLPSRPPWRGTNARLGPHGLLRGRNRAKPCTSLTASVLPIQHKQVRRARANELEQFIQRLVRWISRNVVELSS